MTSANAHRSTFFFFFFFFFFVLIVFLSFSPLSQSFPSPPPSSHTNNSTDRHALLSFKSLLFDPTGALASWNDSVDFCRWPGVTCSGRRHPQRATGLELDALGLSGPISPAIGNLTFLRSLVLSYNNFSGPIPGEIGSLSQLVNLTLRRNSLSGEIPPSLTRCSNLQFINLRSNLLKGEIPRDLGLLSNLKGINLWGNQISGTIPETIGNISSLRYIDLGKNSLEGSIPESFGKLTNLLVLQLNTNKFTGEIPSSVFNLSSISDIYLGFNNMTGALPSFLFDQFPNLQSLILYSNNFYGPIPSSISNASYLYDIELFQNQFSGAIPSGLGNSPYLWWVELSDNQLEAEEDGHWRFMDSLTNCSNLNLLALEGNKLGGFLPSSLANLSPGMTTITIGRNRIAGTIPDEIGKIVNLTTLKAHENLLTGTLPSSMANLRQMRVLNLEGNKLSGQIPASIGKLVQLNQLILNSNEFNGTLPASLSNLVNLQTLDLSSNRFSGEIPPELLDLKSLSIEMDLSNNLLSGPLPAEVGGLTSLNWLSVSNNKLSGEIPSAIGDCRSLEYLYLHGNSFQGPIPQSLGNLRALRELDLSKNNLSHEIPNFLGRFMLLQILNLSYNELEGQIPGDIFLMKPTAVSLQENPRLCVRDGSSKLNLSKLNLSNISVCDDYSTSSSKRNHFTLAVKILIPFLAIAFCSSFIFFVFLAFRRRHLQKKLSFKPVEDQFIRASYSDLLKATNGFSESNLIGVGSFGSVFKGIMEPDQTLVAIKVLNLQQHGASRTFMAECEALRNIWHRNLVKILTACSSTDFKGNDFKALVMKFMRNGSLDQWLHHPDPSNSGSRKLNLKQRLNIAVDVASAIDYLHNDGHAAIIHRDLKPSNVLLNDDFCAHLSDFGLSKILAGDDESQTVSLGLKGTIGYVPPEYGMGRCSSTQGDVYSFGILLLELFTGKRPTDEMFKDGLSLREHVETSTPDHIVDIVDPNLLDNRVEEMEEEVKCIDSAIKIGLFCSLNEPRERMEIENRYDTYAIFS
ncbi:putative LRR receptor-like serine/threonine-protein kinase [Apostasia shenzhenica]|uniref:Receptor kinase-like protein Xa21 n=1 Tax=Apostasia shenzhenica TaxID=1088818 RepID=A0A2I0AE30_9ASPA|nr:putative LRR receptor-like serine/threonine-protein kinase [Apostasia shenzhenica]